MLNRAIIREMQIKTTMRCHLTPVRTAIIKKITNNKCWWGCGETRSILHCWWECELVQPLWKIVWGFLKKLKKWITIWTSNSTPGYISEENKTTNSTKICAHWNQAGPCRAPGPGRISVPHFLFVRNRPQPPWPSLCSKGQIWTVANQGKEGMQK